MARWKAIILWTLGVGCLFAMMSFGNQQAKELRVNNLKINIDHSNGFFFVQEEEVREIVAKEYPFVDSLQLREINIALLEERLDNHPSIYKAEVYSNLLGQIQIDVTQKKPLARIMGEHYSYYLTDQGDSMQLSKNYSAQVPLLTGKLNRKTRAEAFAFISKMKQDEFYRNFFAGIHIQPNEQWILYPSAGRLRVEIGAFEDVDKKLQKLKTFYQTVVDESMLNELKRINLQYQGQVVCEKHKNS